MGSSRPDILMMPRRLNAALTSALGRPNSGTIGDTQLWHGKICGIVALAVAFEVSMRKVVEVFEEQGAAIFRRTRRHQARWVMGSLATLA